MARRAFCRTALGTGRYNYRFQIRVVVKQFFKSSFMVVIECVMEELYFGWTLKLYFASARLASGTGLLSNLSIPSTDVPDAISKVGVETESPV